MTNLKQKPSPVKFLIKTSLLDKIKYYIFRMRGKG